MARLCLVVLLSWATLATAAPTVDIRAQSRLALDSVKLRGDDDAIEVRGQLLDRYTNEGLGGVPVTVRMSGHAQTAYTGQDGRFVAVFSGLVPGPQPVELRFAGTTQIDKADPVTQVVDPSRAQVTLSIRTDPQPTGTNLYVTATTDEGEIAIPVQIHVGGVDGDNLKPVATHSTNKTKPFLLTRALAGGAGAKRVRAVFPGDATRQAATTETTLELVSATTTTLALAATLVDYEDDVVATGKVVDSDGKPVVRAQVALTAGDRRLAQAATDDDGGYRFEVEAKLLGDNVQLPKEFGLQVQADPVESFNKTSRSQPAVVTIAAPQPVPVSYTVAAFIATAVAAGGFLLARAKPWRKLRKPIAPADAPAAASDDDALKGGLVANRPGIVSTLRRASDDGFSGIIRDTVRGRPVEDAIVRVTGPNFTAEGRANADGSFALERLALGELRVEVIAPGHITEKFSISIPHRGELRGVRVDLVPVRERVFQLYRRAAEPALPEARLWGIWSPRQIVDHVRARRPSPALSELTDFVEEVYFSPRIASEAVIPAASERVDNALRERSVRRA